MRRPSAHLFFLTKQQKTQSHIEVLLLDIKTERQKDKSWVAPDPLPPSGYSPYCYATEGELFP